MLLFPCQLLQLFDRAELAVGLESHAEGEAAVEYGAEQADQDGAAEEERMPRIVGKTMDTTVAAGKENGIECLVHGAYPIYFFRSGLTHSTRRCLSLADPCHLQVVSHSGP